MQKSFCYLMSNSFIGFIQINAGHKSFQKIILRKSRKKVIEKNFCKTRAIEENIISRSKKSENSNETEKFQSWLVRNGVFIGNKSIWGKPPHPCIVASETTDDGEFSGRGLLTSRDVQQNEKIIEIPEEIVIGKKLFNSQFEDFKNLNDYDKLAIIIIKQRSLGKKSRWLSYFNILPDENDLNLTFRWKLGEVYPLKSSKVLKASIALKNKINDQFHRVNKALFVKNQLKYPEKIFNLKSWEWAMTILLSRAIRMQSTGEISLVPYADLLNHNPFSTCFINLKKVPFTELNEVAMYVDKPYGKFEQIFTSYGSKSNLELLILYGFNLERNPFDCYEIRISLSEKDKLIPGKTKFLNECNKSDSITFPILYYQYPEELFEFAYFCFVNSSDIGQEDLSEFEFQGNQEKKVSILVKNSIRLGITRRNKLYSRISNNIISQVNLNSSFDVPRNHKVAIKQLRCEDKILNRFFQDND